jgi:molybdopterin molybdotransferase
MISTKQARKILSENLKRSEKKEVSLKDSLGKILAENVFSPIDVPSFDNSAKDGYALKFDEKRDFYTLKNTVQAGDTAEYFIGEGEAARIFTGAKMPQGSDTAVLQEIVERDEKTGKITFPKEKVQAGKDVRYKGSQCKKGDLIVEKGTKITPGTIGLLASVGLAKVWVFAPPKVAYIITGNELKEIGASLKEGQIYNANGPMLEALLTKTGILEITASKASDDKNELQQSIDIALEKTDVLLLSGGISVGDYDFVKECLKNSGVEELFYKVKQRPGKPFFAGKKSQKWIFALPGNPASVFSCYNQYVKPCLRFLMGQDNVWESDFKLVLQQDQKKKSGLTFFLKAKREGKNLEILSGQQSFNLQAFSKANCLVELEEESEIVKKGTFVKTYNL